LEDKEAVEDDEKTTLEVEMSKKISSRDEIKWTFNGRKIDVEDDNRYALEKDNKICRLVIKKVKLEDEGTYAVEVNNSRSSGYLTVNGKGLI
jgi:hypothetical protein